MSSNPPAPTASPSADAPFAAPQAPPPPAPFSLSRWIRDLNPFAKGAIIAFTKSVAREVVPMGILVNCIAPGFIDTPMTSIIDGEVRKQIEGMTPIGRFGEPGDIAAAALFLACDDSKFMVGQVLSPNGGYVI